MIARRMPHAVIHRLKVIKIDLHHCEPLFPRNKTCQHMVHRTAVLETRQRVSKGLLLRGDLGDL